MPSLQCVSPSSMQLWRDVIDSLVSHSLWLRVLLGLPEKETTYLDTPEELGQTPCSHACTWPSHHPSASACHTPPVRSVKRPLLPFPLSPRSRAQQWPGITLLQLPRCTGGVPEGLKACLCHTWGSGGAGTRTGPLAPAPSAVLQGGGAPAAGAVLFVCGDSLNAAESTLLFPTPACGVRWVTGHTVSHSPSSDRKLPSAMEVKPSSMKVGKEDRRGAAQEKKQLGTRDKEDKKGAKLPGKEACCRAGSGLGRRGAGEDTEGLQEVTVAFSSPQLSQ